MFEEIDGKNERRDTKPHKSALRACYTNDLIYVTIDVFTQLRKSKQLKFYSNFVQVLRIFRISKK